MSATMTLRERARAALKGETPDRVPFTAYSNMVPSGTDGERLQALGLTPLHRAAPYRTRRPNVKVEKREIKDGRYPAEQFTYTTPVGSLTMTYVIEPGYGSRWIKEYLVKEPEDYAVLEFMIRDEIVEPDIDGFLETDKALGDGGIALARAADPPTQELWRRMIGLERFCLDLHDCPDEVKRVIDALADRNRKIWEIVANTPSDFCSSGGNLSGDLVGPDMFNEFILPHFEGEAGTMHKAGKRLVNHMDGMLRSLLGAVADCPVDVIEAFNPTPDGNVSVAEALAAWPDKVVSINFPSSVHLGSPEYIRATTIDLLRQAAPGGRFVVGITENVPADRVVPSFTVICETLEEFGRCPIDANTLPEVET